MKFEWRPWLWTAFAMIFPIFLTWWCTLVFPGQTTLVKNIVASAVGGDARYWSRGQWRADVLTLDSLRHWMLDREPPVVVEAEAIAPVTLVTTNSDLLKPTV